MQIDRQAEDFYVERNHSGLVRSQHSEWHRDYPFFVPGYDGLLFFTFHRKYIAFFNAWRAEFGYPAIAMWNPATPPPTDAASNHALRNPSYTPDPIPTVPVHHADPLRKCDVQ